MANTDTAQDSKVDMARAKRGVDCARSAREPRRRARREAKATARVARAHPAAVRDRL